MDDVTHDLGMELAGLRRIRADVVPPNVVAHMDQATAALAESKVADRAVDVGTRAPAFTLPDVSGQTPDNSLSTAEKNGLTYEVLSDVGLTVARSYGLVFELPDYLQTDYRELGHPLSQFNGTNENILPIPGTFVIDQTGIVRYAYVNPNYMYRADPKTVIAALVSLSGDGDRSERSRPRPR